MTTLTDIVAAVVVHFSAIAFSHFGMTLEPLRLERPAPVERVVARSPRPAVKVSDHPQTSARPLRT